MSTDSPNVSLLAGQVSTLRDDVTNVAQICQQFAVQLQTNQTEARDYIDRKDEKNRGRFLSILSVFVPVVLGLGSILWAVIGSNNELIHEMNTSVVSAQIETAKQLGRLEAQIEILMRDDCHAGK